MAAGLGFKTFTTGEVLTAADTNGYLMQGVLVFASAAARDAAITSPQEGQFAYLKDTNVTTYYTGSAWTNLDTTGMTNPMTTTGDMVYSSSGSTPARLGIGSTSQVLTVTAGIPSWATPAGGGGMTLLGSGTLSGATVTLSSIPNTYKNLTIILDSINQSTTDFVNIRLNNSTTNVGVMTIYSTSLSDNSYGGTIFVGSANSAYRMNPSGTNAFQFTIYNYAASEKKAISGTGGYQYSTDTNQINFATWGSTTDATAYNRIDIVTASGTFSSGNYKIYGVS